MAHSLFPTAMLFLFHGEKSVKKNIILFVVFINPFLEPKARNYLWVKWCDFYIAIPKESLRL